MKKQMTILAAAAILGAFASAAVAAVPTITLTGGLSYLAEYNMLDRVWTDGADGVLNNPAPTVTMTITTTGNPNVGAITLTNTVASGAYAGAISGTVKGFNVSLGTVNADWDGITANTSNAGGSIFKTAGNSTFTLATTAGITTAAVAAIPATTAADVKAEVPGIAYIDGAPTPVAWTAALEADEKADALADPTHIAPIVVLPYVPAVTLHGIIPGTAAVWDIVNAGKVSVALGNSTVYGALVMDPAWAGVGFVGATSKVGSAAVTAKAGKLFGAAGSASAMYAKAEIPVTPTFNVTAKAVVAPAAYAYAHLDSDSYVATNGIASGNNSVDDWTDMDYIGWVAKEADRNNGKLNAYVKANLTVSPDVAPYGVFDYSANGNYVMKAGTSYKALYVNDAYVAISDAAGSTSTEFYAGLGKGAVSAFVGYKLTGATGDTQAEVKLTKAIDWVTTWASLGKAYASTKPYVKVGASAAVTF